MPMKENMNFTDFCLRNGGDIYPLVLPSQVTDGTGLMNPSIFVHQGRIYVNIRHVNYTLYHSEKKKYHHQWGPLQYLHPENQRFLKTTNFLCQLADDFSIEEYFVVDTSQNDVQPLWEFIGLEDARLFVWEDKFYLCGVRRDTTTNGEGRMELSEIEINSFGVKEKSRQRIPIPDGTFSYCEKNWMPIVSRPYHWVKWANPTEVVEYDPYSGKTTTEFNSTTKKDIANDLRGGSQVIDYNGYYLCITHEVFLYNSELGRKDGRYRHRFVLWDKNWDIVAYSNYFNFMDGEIEFCCGAAFHEGNLLISYGFQDNGAYILKVPENLIESMFVYDTREKFSMPECLVVFKDSPSEAKFGPKDHSIIRHKHGTPINNISEYHTVVIPESLIHENIYSQLAEKHVVITAESEEFYKKCLEYSQNNTDFCVDSIHESNKVVVFEKR